MSYSETQIVELSRKNPKELARILISPDVDARALTFGVEIFGAEIADEELVIPVFRKLLKHVHALVREGAMMGIAAFYSNKSPPRDIVDRLRVISKTDPSPINKEAARNLLENLER